LREGGKMKVVVFDAHKHLLARGSGGNQRVDVALRQPMKRYRSIAIAMEVDARGGREVDDVRLLIPGNTRDRQNSVLRAVVSANP